MSKSFNTSLWTKFLAKNKAKNLEILLNFINRTLTLKKNGFFIPIEIPMENFYISGFGDKQIIQCVDLLEKIRLNFCEKDNENLGILSIPAIPLKIKSGVVSGLSELPLNKIAERLNLHLSGGRSDNLNQNKPIIVLSEEGIYLKENKNLIYTISRDRKKIVKIIAINLQCGARLKDFINLIPSKKPDSKKQEQNIHRDIKTINKEFMECVNQKFSLIKHSKSNGYCLNTDKFEFENLFTF